MAQIPLSDAASADRPEFDKLRDDKTRQIAPDVAYRQIAIVNVIFFGRPGAGDGNWTLIDPGMPGAAFDIRSAAQTRFGGTGRPSAIVLTHGHFDHVGPLETLAKEWDVPIYAHKLEHPYLNGTESYPPPDPTVGGGLMSLLSPLYPRKPVDVSERLRPLPDDGSVPGMAGWRWLHTPGHTQGHVSLWRESGGRRGGADPFIPPLQESAYAAITQAPEMHGPPMYFTPDWVSARASVQSLAALAPDLVVTGHGQAMQGREMRAALQELARRFDEVAVPPNGKECLK